VYSVFIDRNNRNPQEFIIEYLTRIANLLMCGLKEKITLASNMKKYLCIIRIKQKYVIIPKQSQKYQNFSGLHLVAIVLRKAFTIIKMTLKQINIHF